MPFKEINCLIGETVFELAHKFRNGMSPDISSKIIEAGIFALIIKNPVSYQDDYINRRDFSTYLTRYTIDLFLRGRSDKLPNFGCLSQIENDVWNFVFTNELFAKYGIEEKVD